MRIYFLSIMILTIQTFSATHLLANFETKKVQDDWCSCSQAMNPEQACQSDEACSAGAPGNGIFCNSSPRYSCPGKANVCWYNGC